MIAIEEARNRILSAIKNLPPEKVHLIDALDRYLHTDVFSEMDIPPADNSAMDGYALRFEDLAAGNRRFDVIYELPAGSIPGSPVEKNQAVRIMTGAPVPPGADAVVMREFTTETPGEVIIEKPPTGKEHIRFKGEDIKKHDKILEKGSLLGPSQIGILASTGHSMVEVTQRPIVAILATGDEISDLDEQRSGRTIYSSNSYTLMALVRRCGAIPVYIGIARDNESDLNRCLASASRADLVLTSGGVSMGDYDLVREIMISGDNSMDFWKVEIKPGKPLAFGTINSRPTIGLPGNPVSTMTSFYQFARPAILKMQGSRNLLLPRVRASLTEEISKKNDRANYVRGILSRENGDLVVRPDGPQGSGILTSMSKGNCFIILPKEITRAVPGEMVECEIYQGL